MKRTMSKRVLRGWEVSDGAGDPTTLAMLAMFGELAEGFRKVSRT